ncbi:MAG: hypothetical protein ETSY2_45955 [Candidatus Entotheonella gemina]|uniref:Uncharacterized protein n=1 Tax=Candidatus Entotheonella gemina TaxID=1429439 RepID=W4LF46_9BACT|nr:MAG: hypothetical protein ETSY2_45955 [Candidatus Entotheonella gemina]
MGGDTARYITSAEQVNKTGEAGQGPAPLIRGRAEDRLLEVIGPKAGWTRCRA